jgi:hypothetical protein
MFSMNESFCQADDLSGLEKGHHGSVAGTEHTPEDNATYTTQVKSGEGMDIEQ